MKKLIIFFLIVYSILYTGIINAQTSGAIDLTFNSYDVGYGFGDGTNSQVETVSIQGDNKIIFGGQFTSYNGETKNYLTRVNPNGLTDSSFHSGTGPNGNVFASVIQSDGKIIVGGMFSNYNGISKNRIARINTNGSLDASFTIGAGANSNVNAIAVQSDGKIIIGGIFTTYNGVTVNHIARLNANGTLDATFNVGLGTDVYVRTISIQTDGKIIIGGNFTTYNGLPCGGIARLNINGSLDGTFAIGTGASADVYSTAIQTDGKILIGGIFTSFNGTTMNYIGRLNTNGSIDGTFSGTGTNTFVKTIRLQTDGKILIGGWFSTYNGTPCNKLTRLNVNGTIDALFDAGEGANYEVLTLDLQADGKIVIGGHFNVYNNSVKFNLLRSNSDGSVDSTFNTGTGANNAVTAITLQPDGKILIGGDFENYNGTPVNNLVRLNSTGIVDTTFHIGLGVGTYTYMAIEVNAIAVQLDGKILIGGHFLMYNGDTAKYITRLNANGSKDLTFLGTGTNNNVMSIVIQSDGKILIAGDFTTYNGTSVNRIARLNPNGTIDPTFNIGTAANGGIRAMVLQPDGKILIGGGFTTFNGQPVNYLARLNTNGTIDNGFNTGTGLVNNVTALALQPDGNIIVGGPFWQYNSFPTGNLIRVSSIGILDGSFTPNAGFAIDINTAAIQNDGKIIIGGFFNTVNGVNANKIARLNSNGSLDTNFIIGSGANNHIWTAIIQPDGKALIGGRFTAYNNVGRNRITRIETVCGPPVITNTTPVNDLNICDGQSTTLLAAAQGIITWYANPTSTLAIGTGSALATPTLSTGTYTFYAEANTCMVSANRESFLVTVNTIPTLTVTGTGSVCIGTNTHLTASGATSYAWSSGDITPTIVATQIVTETFTVTGTTSCGSVTETITVNVDNTCADVWPGDANSDGIADNLDILELGLHYTHTGAPRANLSNNWQPYFANNWLGTITNGKNLNHSDCNGDGTIDDNDTLAIFYNYSQIHTLKPVITTTVNPQLIIVADQASVIKGNWGSASVYFGDAVNPINNANGLAFTVDFDNSLIEPNVIYIEYQNSFIDVNQNLHFQKLDFPNSKLFTASTHTNNINVSGFGKIATVHFQIANSITSDQTLNISVSLANQSNAMGLINPLTSGTTSLMAIGAITGMQNNFKKENDSLYPNPTNGLFTIDLPVFSEIFITNVLGENILNKKFISGKHYLDIQNQPAGIYFVKINSNKEEQTIKIIKE